VSPAIPTCAPLWPTPDAGGFNLTESVEGFLSRRRERGAVSSDDQRRSIPLGVAVRMDKCWCRCHTSMSSVAGSPAKTSATPAGAQGSTGNARVFGSNTHDSFANYDPATSLWKTSQLSLLEDSGEFSETWPRAGMTRSGTASRLVPLAPLTAATGSGLWPTPHGICAPGPRRAGPSGNELGRAVNRAEWPTPTAQDASNDGGPSQFERNSLPLNAAVKWPTPNARDYKGSPGAGARERGGHQASLPASVKDANGSGSLNPTWVEWLMNFPLGWTEVD
jgi:hypothetical protein